MAYRICVLCFLGLAGCSTHPIPADRIGWSVYDIAHKIRCEAREVLHREAYMVPARKTWLDKLRTAEAELKVLTDEEKKVFADKLPGYAAERETLAAEERYISARLDELFKSLETWRDTVLSKKNEKKEDTSNEAEKEENKKREADRNQAISTEGVNDAKDNLRKAKELLALREKNEKKIRNFNSRLRALERDRLEKLQEIVRKRQAIAKQFDSVLKFLGNTFAYAMRFEIEETNDARINTADFTRAVTLGTITIGVGAGDKRQRKARREVRVAATFRELLALEKECAEGKYFMDGDGVHVLRYPIKGRIGLDEVIMQYLRIVDGKFALADTAMAGKTYSSIITFTTTIDGSIKPSASITRSSGDRFSGNGVLSGQRQDLHEATIVIVPPAKSTPVEPDKTVNVRIVRSNSLLQD